MVSFCQVIDSLFVQSVRLVTHGKNDVCERLALRWVHFDKNAHVLGVTITLSLSSVLEIDKISVPLHNILEILLAKNMSCVNLVFDDFFTGARLEIVRP